MKALPLDAPERVISQLLRFGVLSSFILILAGMALFFFDHPEYFSSPSELLPLTRPGAVFPHSLSDVARDMKNLNGQAVVSIGLLLLIATPILRVAVSVLIFIRQRDRVFSVITLLVLAVLLLSFFTK